MQRVDEEDATKLLEKIAKDCYFVVPSSSLRRCSFQRLPKSEGDISTEGSSDQTVELKRSYSRTLRRTPLERATKPTRPLFDPHPIHCRGMKLETKAVTWFLRFWISDRAAVKSKKTKKLKRKGTQRIRLNNS